MESTPVVDVQKQHVTIRHFTEQGIEDDMLDAILEAGCRAPTSSNMQSYSVIIVKDQEAKKQLAKLSGDQKHIETCPVFLAFCADLNRLETVCQMHGTTMENNLKTFLVSTVDASLVGMSVQTAAESFGLGGVMIGALRKNLESVSELLDLPKGVYVVFGMCIGWPEKEMIPPQKPRLPKDLIIHREKYNHKDIKPLIEKYDSDLMKHYEALGRNLNPAAWSGPISRNLSQPNLPENIQILGKLGFEIR